MNHESNEKRESAANTLKSNYRTKSVCNFLPISPILIAKGGSTLQLPTCTFPAKFLYANDAKMYIDTRTLRFIYSSGWINRVGKTLLPV